MEKLLLFLGVLVLLHLNTVQVESLGENHVTADKNVKPVQPTLKTDTHEWDDEFEGTPTLRDLHDYNFEHDTQAATGQTTGLWLVLFWSHYSVTCRDAEAALLQVFVQLREIHLIVAGVNISSNPRTVKRFNVHEVPRLILFRDRHMYTYKGHWAAMNIIKFVQGGYRSVPEEEVPKEITYFDQLLETPLLYYEAIVTYLGNRPGILAAVGSIMSMVGYLWTRKWLLKKHIEQTARTRPAKSGKRID